MNFKLCKVPGNRVQGRVHAKNKRLAARIAKRLGLVGSAYVEYKRGTLVWERAISERSSGVNN